MMTLWLLLIPTSVLPLSMCLRCHGHVLRARGQHNSHVFSISWDMDDFIMLQILFFSSMLFQNTVLQN